MPDVQLDDTFVCDFQLYGDEISSSSANSVCVVLDLGMT